MFWSLNFHVNSVSLPYAPPRQVVRQDSEQHPGEPVARRGMCDYGYAGADVGACVDGSPPSGNPAWPVGQSDPVLRPGTGGSTPHVTCRDLKM